MWHMNHDSGIPILRTLAGANKYGKRINVVYMPYTANTAITSPLGRLHKGRCPQTANMSAHSGAVSATVQFRGGAIPHRAG